MIRVFLILIGFWAGISTALGWAEDCTSPLVLTAPRTGARTFHDSITVRGFLCQEHPLVIVRNGTTKSSIFADTREVCNARGCVYSFTAPMRELAVGSNDISAEIPGDPPIEVHVEVIRTALAGIF